MQSSDELKRRTGIEVAKKKSTRGATLKEGIIYDRDGWKIWQPVPTVWIVSVPGIGVVSAMCYPHNQAVYIRVMPLGATPVQFRGAGVREGIVYGVKQACTITHRLIDIKKVMKVLDEAGIYDDMAGVLSVDTHKKLVGMINQLMAAAYAGGIEELDKAALGLASSTK